MNRNLIQCTTVCRHSDDCGAFEWNESTNECSIYGKTDLICDKNEVDAISLHVDQTNIPSTTCGGIS